MRRKNNYLVAVANNGKLRQRFTPGVPRTFDQDCSFGTIVACISAEKVQECNKCISVLTPQALIASH